MGAGEMFLIIQREFKKNIGKEILFFLI